MESTAYITDEHLGPRHDPVIPDSIGGLLAEEYTMDPNSPLPSFLEMTMIDEARRQGCQTLSWVLQQIRLHLIQIGTTTDDIRMEQREEQAGTNENNGRSRISLFVSRLLRIRSKCALFLATKILGPYNSEILFFITYMLERKSLLSHSTSATISEALYGGRRVKIVPSENNKLTPMSKQDGIRLAFLFALGPYLTQRCSIFYSKLDQPSQQRLPTKLKKMIKFLFPFLNMSVQGIHLLYRFKYLLGQSFFFDGYSRYLNLVVRRVTMEDQQEQQSNSETKMRRNDSKFEGRRNQSAMIVNGAKIVLKSKRFRQVALTILSSTVALGWIARIRASRMEANNQRRQERLLQQQQQQQQSTTNANNNERRRQTNDDNIDEDTFPPHPPPPTTQLLDPSLAKISPRLCPICRRPRINPTASTSGYVFCLKCILSAIGKNPVCPITGKSCPEASIVQLFEPHL